MRLTGFDDKQKVPLIKEIKTLVPGMNLVQVIFIIYSKICPYFHNSLILGQEIRGKCANNCQSRYRQGGS